MHAELRDVRAPLIIVNAIHVQVRAMNFVIEQGWALYWGTSEWTSARAYKQRQYNVHERSKVEYDYNNLNKKYKHGLTTWSPLESGILTGKYNNGIPEASPGFVHAPPALKPTQ
ncbi:TPA: hypothetical protein N0F65_001217 [Lagenidium giganteum]|uniref:Uncharacterized protein n=1 Tax=Lagenidium giganteum TaxID=4803 RepID=A0AAV2Z0A2_9STRA|nr:TPA: hypothetical protein N0F65_001217 [Lagenidium giganteum]